tara:strand:+ start:238 stop:696 length:459 start_codon:yes stop_codon:yes gene_type:complete
MKKINIILIFIPMFLMGQNDQYAEYKDNLIEYFEITNTNKMIEFSLDQTINMMVEGDAFGIGDVPKSVLEDYVYVVKNELLEDFVDLCIPVYMKFLSNRDLKNIIKFYKTPSGRKLAKHTPDMTQELTSIFETWGEKMGEEIAKKITDKLLN